MTTGEQERFELRNRLIEALGEDVATKLMDSLPPFSWDQVATKDDLNTLSATMTAKFDQVDAQFTAVAAEFVNLRGEISKEIGRLDSKITTEIGALDSKITTEIGALDSKITTEIGALDSKITTEIGALDSSFSKKITEQTRIMVLMISGFSLTVCGAMAGGILFA